MFMSKWSSILFLLMSISCFAKGGGDVGNGGDGYSLEFVSFGQSLIRHWDELQLSSTLRISKEAFSSALAKAHVYSTADALFVGQVEVDAKNYPFCEEKNPNPSVPCGQILINRIRWDVLMRDPVRKMALVLHEYLGVLGVNGQRFDDFYEVTSQALEPIRTIFSNQRRVNLNFACTIEGWDAKSNRPYVITEVDTYTESSPRVGFSAKQKNDGAFDFWIELAILPGDLLSPTLVNQLSYRLYTAHPLQLPTEADLVSHDSIEFKEAGMRSLRILNGPDLQLKCFRVFDGMNGR